MRKKYLAVISLSFLAILMIIGVSGTHTKHKAQAQTVVTPTLYCLAAACPGQNISGTVTPSQGVSPAISLAPPVLSPTISVPAVAGTQPCASGTSAVSTENNTPNQGLDRRGSHRGNGGFLKDIFQLLITFLELVVKFSGGTMPCNLATPIPASAPSVVPSNAPSIAPVSTAPATSPAKSNTTGSGTPKKTNEILSLKNWNLTIPTGSPATTIKSSELVGGYQDEFFYPNATNDGIVFHATVEGGTTENSSHTRSELREISPEGTMPWGWSAGQGSHIMKATQAITHLPGGPGKSGRVGFAQIHGAGSVWYLILEAADNNDGTITLKVHDETKKVDQAVIDDKYVLGTKFDLEFAAVNGTVTVKYNNEVKVTTDTDLQDAYFKIGAYNQSKGDFSEVVVYSVTVQHN